MPLDEGDFGSLVIQDPHMKLRLASHIPGTNPVDAKTGGGAGQYSALAAAEGAAQLAAPLVTGAVIMAWDPVLLMALAGDLW